MSAKRNFGLLLAKLVGWSKVVFREDDIDVPDPLDLCFAAGLTSYVAGVGLQIDGMQDNSVVCPRVSRCRRRAGLVLPARRRPAEVDTDRHGGARRNSTRTSAPTGRGGEEFGDTLAEGLFWLLDTGRSVQGADRAFWAEFVEKRRGLTSEVTVMVRQVDPSPYGCVIQGSAVTPDWTYADEVLNE